jgi:hypothetical protein
MQVTWLAINAFGPRPVAITVFRSHRFNIDMTKCFTKRSTAPALTSGNGLRNFART